jgi:hypothetical protein
MMFNDIYKTFGQTVHGVMLLAVYIPVTAFAADDTMSTAIQPSTGAVHRKFRMAPNRAE